jgi:hypothetical protein
MTAGQQQQQPDASTLQCVPRLLPSLSRAPAVCAVGAVRAELTDLIGTHKLCVAGSNQVERGVRLRGLAFIH